jgi:hypothetical protein
MNWMYGTCRGKVWKNLFPWPKTVKDKCLYEQKSVVCLIEKPVNVSESWWWHIGVSDEVDVYVMSEQCRK